MTSYKRQHPDPLRVPREGSKLRRVYDALLSGEKVVVLRIAGNKNGAGHYTEMLRSFYNCEIVREGNGVRMIGRWDGFFFVPVERLEGWKK